MDADNPRDEMTPSDARAPPARSREAQARVDRRAEALRTNLKRRKTQTRERAEAESGTPRRPA